MCLSVLIIDLVFHDSWYSRIVHVPYSQVFSLFSIGQFPQFFPTELHRHPFSYPLVFLRVFFKLLRHLQEHPFLPSKLIDSGGRRTDSNTYSTLFLLYHSLPSPLVTPDPITRILKPSRTLRTLVLLVLI